MTKYDARKIRDLFDRGENVIQWIQSQEGAGHNSDTAILYSYDAQAGSYVDRLNDPAARVFNEEFCKSLARVIDEFAPDSVLDAGTGEATTLAAGLDHMVRRPRDVSAFDISLSRLLFARRHLAAHGHQSVRLFTGDLDRIPVTTASVDLVITVHAVEPNHHREDSILAELLRVARRHLVMIEPSYEFASKEARARMERLGYVRGLPAALERLGHPALLIERWQHNSNPLNKAALIVVDKRDVKAPAPFRFASPISGAELIDCGDYWFCPHDGHAFPIVAGIPCLTTDNAILASKLTQFQA